MNERMKKVAIGAGGAGVLIIIVIILYNVFSSPSCQLTSEVPKKVEAKDTKTISGDKAHVLISTYLKVAKKDGDKSVISYLETQMKSVSNADPKLLTLTSTCMSMNWTLAIDPKWVNVTKIEVAPVSQTDLSCTVTDGVLPAYNTESNKFYKCLNKTVEYPCVIKDEKTRPTTDVKLLVDNLEFVVNQDTPNFDEKANNICA